MKIPNEIADKARCYMDHYTIAKENYDAVCKWLSENTDASDVCVENILLNLNVLQTIF